MLPGAHGRIETYATTEIAVFSLAVEPSLSPGSGFENCITGSQNPDLPIWPYEK